MSLGCKDIGIRKLKFVAKTQFLCSIGIMGPYSLYEYIEGKKGTEEPEFVSKTNILNKNPGTIFSLNINGKGFEFRTRVVCANIYHTYYWPAGSRQKEVDFFSYRHALNIVQEKGGRGIKKNYFIPPPFSYGILGGLVNEDFKILLF